MPTEERIVIKPMAKPSGKENIDELMVWFCKAFDLTSGDEDLEPTLFKEVASASISGSGVTSKELNDRLDVPRTTVIYHLNRFIGSGLVVRKGRKYVLRSSDMEGTIEELQADMAREFNRMLEFAERLDRVLAGDAFGGSRETRKIEQGRRGKAGRNSRR